MSFSASAVDNVDGLLPGACTPASGTTFPLGATMVSWLGHPNTGSASFTVSVVDTTAPALTVPAPATVVAEKKDPMPYSYSATATDAVDGIVTPVCSPPSGSLFPIGSTTVTCTAADAHGNTARASFSVTVVLSDTQAPHVDVPQHLKLEATSAAGAVAFFEATARDKVDGVLIPTCVPASGSTFRNGTTKVTCTARDTTPPAITLPSDATVTTTERKGASFTYIATASP